MSLYEYCVEFVERFRIHKQFIGCRYNLKKGVCMRKSRLELYESILEALISKPSTIDRIAYEINLDCTILRQRLDFLIKNSLVEERGLGKITLYAITERGIAVLKALNFEKYLGKIINKIEMVDEALQVIRKLENKNKKKNTKN